MGKQDRKFLANNLRTYMSQDKNKPVAFIVDIDGTVALMDNRNPFDEKLWHTDKPNQPIIDLIDFLAIGLHSHYGYSPRILFVSGREGGKENVERIEEWMEIHLQMQPIEYELFTRAMGDQRSDVIIKRELFEAHIEGKYNVLWVFDDRDSVVKFWRDDMKLPTLQVHWGDF